MRGDPSALAGIASELQKHSGSLQGCAPSQKGREQGCSICSPPSHCLFPLAKLLPLQISFLTLFGWYHLTHSKCSESMAPPAHNDALFKVMVKVRGAWVRCQPKQEEALGGNRESPVSVSPCGDTHRTASGGVHPSPVSVLHELIVHGVSAAGDF